MIVIIDNYDSFTYNIVQTIAGNCRQEGLKTEIRVFRNDKISISEIEALKPDRLLISPGPCTLVRKHAARAFSLPCPTLSMACVITRW